MTKVFGLVAWLAVAVIAIVGIARGQDTETLVLLCISTAISAIPDGLADVRAGDAVVGSTAARRRQGGRQVAQRRRDARRHDGHQQRQDRHADHERDDGDHDAGGTASGSRWRAAATRRRARSWASPGAELPDFSRLALGLVAVYRRDRRRRRVRHRRPDRGCVRRARREDGCRRRRRRVARCRGGPRCRSTPSTSSWRRSTTARSGSPAAILQRAALHDASRAHPTSCSNAAARRCGTGDVGADRDGARRDPGREPAAVGAGAAGSGVRRPRPRRGRDGGVRSPIPMAAVAGPGLRRPGRDHRSAPRRGEGRGPRRARRRHRRTDDHRRPHGHGTGDRRPARPRTGRDHRSPSSRPSRTPRWSSGCRSCTSSAGWRRRTSSGWLA